MANRWDAIVVGSGFGGAVAACRLSEAGARVLVLERGRRWGPDTFPRGPNAPWFYSHDHAATHNGWLDLRVMGRLVVAMGAGVGGGSLCYSSVLLVPPADRFATGWPPEITAESLAPYYDRAKSMLLPRPIPEGQTTRRADLLRRSAEKLGWSNRYSKVPLAIRFDDSWNYDLENAVDAARSKPVNNDQGHRQGTCVHLGNCDIGCDVLAKNTLDLNYIARAESLGAEVRPLCLVRWLRPEGSHWRVGFDRIDGGQYFAKEELADKVVLAAGSLGTTELLLRSRDEYRTLDKLSPRLGMGFSPNANVLSPDFYPTSADIRQSLGPTISSGLEFGDGAVRGERFVIQDDGFPNLLFNVLKSRGRRPSLLTWVLGRDLRRGVGELNPLGNVMVWLGAGVDAGDGRLTLRRHLLRFWKRSLSIHWSVEPSRGVVEAILNTHRELSKAGGGALYVPLFWRIFRGMTTVHPLGGCGIGRQSSGGVVDHAGEVFGHPGLFVLDGASLPMPIGRNPSLTITALSERAAEMMTRN
jgi:cholesterol oxidase